MNPSFKTLEMILIMASLSKRFRANAVTEKTAEETLMIRLRKIKMNSNLTSYNKFDGISRI